MGMQILFKTLISIVLYNNPEGGVLGHMVVVASIILRNFHTVIQRGHTILHFCKLHESSHFSLYPNQCMVFFSGFLIGHPNKYEVISHCGFYCIYLMISDADHRFCLPVGHFLWRQVYSSSLPIFKMNF